MIDPNQLKKVDLCRFTALSDQTISNYVKQGLPVANGGKGAGARYNLSDCIAWIQNYEVQKALKNNRQTDAEGVDELNERLLKAKVEREEYKTAQLLGSLVTIDEASTTINREMERVRAKLLSIPAVWGAQIIGLKEIPDAVDLLGDLVFNMMQELAADTDTDDDETPEQDGESEENEALDTEND